MHGGELLFSKEYGEPDGRRRRISPPSHCDVIRHSARTLSERGGTITDLTEGGGRKRFACFEGINLVSHIDHVYDHVGLCGIVERVTVNRVEIDETCDFTGVLAANPA
jgi:hypothetical protein